MFHAHPAGQFPSWEKARRCPPSSIIDTIELAGLHGKGGAGFPMHRKLRRVNGNAAPRKVVVVNGSEHEPGSLKDRYLLSTYPEIVLEGALIAAHAAGAKHIIVAINGTAQEALDSFGGRVEQCRRLLAGMQVDVVPVPDAYIVGEETALLEVLEGRQPLPRKRPPLPVESGYLGMPTVIQNVETVAHLPFIITQGAPVYAEAGVTLCSLGSEFACPGVHEVRLGTPLGEILYDRGGGLSDGSPIKAVQTGGPSSGFLGPRNFDVAFDAPSLAAHGASLGCAAIRAYSQSECMVRVMAGIVNFFARESCGQCPQCRMETQMLDAIFKQVLDGKGSWQLLDRTADIFRMVEESGQCGFIRMPKDPVMTGIALFKEEFSRFIDLNLSRPMDGRNGDSHGKTGATQSLAD